MVVTVESSSLIPDFKGRSSHFTTKNNICPCFFSGDPIISQGSFLYSKFSEFKIFLKSLSAFFFFFCSYKNEHWLLTLNGEFSSRQVHIIKDLCGGRDLTRRSWNFHLHSHWAWNPPLVTDYFLTSPFQVLQLWIGELVWVESVSCSASYWCCVTWSYKGPV